MLAAKFYDGVLGVDIHWELVPAPPAPPIPTPFPNPFVGMVFDPLGLGVGLVISNAIGLVCGDPPTGPVMVNFVPAANTGTEVMGFGHILIPPGVSWAPMPSVNPAIKPDDVTEPDNPGMPDNDGTIVTGSKTVHVMGSNWSRLGDMVMTCSEPVRLPSSVVLATPKGMPVLVGGPPALDFMAAAGALLRSRWVSDRLHALVNRFAPERLRSLIHRAVCFLTGHPVDVATGRALTYHTDFELPGPIPLKFERSYDSSWSHRSSPLGFGWTHSLHQRVWVERGRVVYLAEDGRELEFDTFDLPGHAMRRGDSLFDAIHRLTLTCLGDGRWEIAGVDGIIHEFAPVVGGSPDIACLVSKSTRDGHHRVALNYDESGNLSWVRDSGGRRVRFEHDAHGRLLRVMLPTARGDGHYEHMRYRYDEWHDLVEATDAARNSWTFEYAGHLLTRETDRNGLSFYFGYDGIGPNAWCVRTWGDGGIYDHELTYDKRGHVTAVTDSLGHTTIYRMNALGVVTEVVDPFGNATTYAYDLGSLRPTLEVDAAGHATRRSYDPRGNLIRVEQPDGSVTTIEHHPTLDLIVRAVDPNGGEWRHEYDSFGRMTGECNPLGHWHRYEWTGGLLTATTTPGGARTSLEYDEATNLSRITEPTGSVTRHEYDGHGRVVKLVDPCGGVERRAYDATGNLTEAVEPHGLRQCFEYDKEQNLTRLLSTERDVSLTYTGYYRLHERREAGTVIRHHYDTEDQVVGIENEAGERWSFERDARGFVVSETAFDRAVRTYERDALGLTTRITKPSGQTDTLHHDACARLVRVEHSDGTWERFAYDPCGTLNEATNDAAAVLFERDELGRLSREITRFADGTERWVQSGFGPDGDRVHVRTSDGHVHHVEHDAGGRVTRIELEGRRWSVDFARDALGRELSRTFSSGVGAVWHRDSVGRPLRRLVTSSGRTVDQREYQWEGDARLRAILDSAAGATQYAHDERGRLASTRLPWGEEQHTSRDVVGNIYASPRRDDRRYGPGGRLEEVEGTTYAHDADGNLARKTDVLGDTTLFRWNGAGMLAGVELPNGAAVEFTYDALARRLSKRVTDRGEEREVRWTWDRANPLAQFDSAEGKTTWVFEPGTNNPLAKLASGRVWGVLTDHIGTPTELVAEDGTVGWQGAVDARGGLSETKRETQNPFRFPGQQHDDETGLSYNRHRYYDPALGRYISPDPIGLSAGIQLYAYVDDPTYEIDPDGLEVQIDSRGLFANRHEYGGGRSPRGRVRIPYQGSRTRDFTVADRMAGFGPDNPRPAGYTWHHANYNARTGHGDMQLVRTTVHEARSHAGGVSRFQQATGLAYDTRSAVQHVEGEGRLRGRPCS